MPAAQEQLASQYQELLEAIYQGCAEQTACPPPPEMQVQSWWNAGVFPCSGTTLRHGDVHILERGRWNRSTGPDFTHAEIELNGTRMRGCIEIDPRAQDWEAHGHGANPAFDSVILHVILTPPPAGWYTRNSQHKDIPILYLPPECWQNPSIHNCSAASFPRCRRPLAAMPATSITRLLQAAAAYRQEIKRTRFNRRVQTAGETQAWYEAWATTLGYHANKEAMLTLAMRAPIRQLGQYAESILLGTAGFLVPVLPDKTSEEARQYHRKVWDSWWMRQEQFTLSAERQIAWNQTPSRPLNHPQRRIAALAASVTAWKSIQPLLKADTAASLAKLLTGLTHPFWSTHYTLTAAPMKTKVALIGQQRIDDFLINHVLPYDKSPRSWDIYLSMKARTMPGNIKRTAELLFGSRNDMEETLKHAYAHQALMQIEADFCDSNICMDCAFPAQLSEWSH
ncbi:MAG: DUF2851 family protein [Akkermansia sp.]|nr:DUF2851 family protein [Akkermansia sp.]